MTACHRSSRYYSVVCFDFTSEAPVHLRKINFCENGSVSPTLFFENIILYYVQCLSWYCQAYKFVYHRVFANLSKLFEEIAKFSIFLESDEF